MAKNLFTRKVRELTITYDYVDVITKTFERDVTTKIVGRKVDTSDMEYITNLIDNKENIRVLKVVDVKVEEKILGISYDDFLKNAVEL